MSTLATRLMSQVADIMSNSGSALEKSVLKEVRSAFAKAIGSFERSHDQTAFTMPAERLLDDAIISETNVCIQDRANDRKNLRTICRCHTGKDKPFH